jgi:hypothetical protein
MHEYNDERSERALPPLGYGEYLRSSHFWEAIAENWESEFLQMGIYVMLTVHLIQRGSSESRIPDEENPQDEDPREHRGDPNAPWSVKRGGWILRLYERSLFTTFLVLFLVSVCIHAYGGYLLYNEEQVAVGKPVVGYFEFLEPPASGLSQFRTGKASSSPLLRS